MSRLNFLPIRHDVVCVARIPQCICFSEALNDLISVSFARDKIYAYFPCWCHYSMRQPKQLKVEIIFNFPRWHVVIAFFHPQQMYSRYNRRDVVVMLCEQLFLKNYCGNEFSGSARKSLNCWTLYSARNARFLKNKALQSLVA